MGGGKKVARISLIAWYMVMPAAILLSGCSAPTKTPPIPQASVSQPLPLSVNGGTGSQFGNYAARIDGEMIDKHGARCVVFVWDRPLTRDLAIRLRSASCPMPENPEFMTCIELERTVIPITESPSLMEEIDPKD